MSDLLDRIHGCEAACTIANAMGDPVEGMSWEKIEEEHSVRMWVSCFTNGCSDILLRIEEVT
jgi:ADP-ribosylglycohydrolase